MLASIAVVVSITGCSSSNGSQSSSPDTVDQAASDHTSTVPKPSSIDEEVADGASYTEIVTPVNCLLKEYGELNKQYSVGSDMVDASDFEEFKTMMGRISEA
jgi:hypothetical protein